MSQQNQHPTDLQCFTRAAARGQETNTLGAQDITSPETIGFWIMTHIETAPDEKLHAALDIALKMRAHKPRKQAD